MSEDLKVARSVVVEVPRERAFSVFTARMGTWWARENTVGSAPMADAVLEPRVGGRWYEVGEDGSEAEWGRVLVWDPPRRVVLAWQLDGHWTYDPDFVTEVDVRFTAEAERRTRVDLEHRDLQRYAAQLEELRTAFASPAGWSGLLAAFAAAATDTTPATADPTTATADKDPV